MDFIKMFNEIDRDHSGEITVAELEDFMKENNFQTEFVVKWLRMFDTNQRGLITIDDFCDRLGLEIDESLEPRLKYRRPSQMKFTDDMDEFVSVDNNMDLSIIQVSTVKPLATTPRRLNEGFFRSDSTRAPKSPSSSGGVRTPSYGPGSNVSSSRVSRPTSILDGSGSLQRSRGKEAHTNKSLTSPGAIFDRIQQSFHFNSDSKQKSKSLIREKKPSVGSNSNVSNASGSLKSPTSTTDGSRAKESHTTKSPTSSGNIMDKFRETFHMNTDDAQKPKSNLREKSSNFGSNSDVSNIGSLKSQTSTTEGNKGEFLKNIKKDFLEFFEEKTSDVASHDSVDWENKNENQDEIIEVQEKEDVSLDVTYVAPYRSQPQEGPILAISTDLRRPDRPDTYLIDMPLQLGDKCGPFPLDLRVIECEMDQDVRDFVMHYVTRFVAARGYPLDYNLAARLKGKLDLEFGRPWHVVITDDEFAAFLSHQTGCRLVFQYGSMAFTVWRT